MVQLSIVLIWNLLFPISFHFGVVSAKKHPQHAATMSTGSPDCFHQLLFWVESSLVSCLIVFERSSNLCLFILNDPMARDISLCFFENHEKSLPIANATSKLEKVFQVRDQGPTGTLEIRRIDPGSVTTTSLPLRTGLSMPGLGWCCFKKHHQLEAMILELFG